MFKLRKDQTWLTNRNAQNAEDVARCPAPWNMVMTTIPITAQCAVVTVAYAYRAQSVVAAAKSTIKPRVYACKRRSADDGFSKVQ